MLEREIREVLNTFPEMEREIFDLRFGVTDGHIRTVDEVAKQFKTTTKNVILVESKALRKLRYTSRTRTLKQFLEKYQIDPFSPIALQEEGMEPERIALRDLIVCADKLTPFLISHLKKNVNDLNKIQWKVFEHLIAEFFASWGYTEVRLVGRDNKTSADIFAIRKVDQSGVDLRFFVEIKKTRKKVGIKVINQVYGAMLEERPRIGWHVGMIVSLYGFQSFQKVTPQELIYKGIELRGREDVIEWLQSYKPNHNGLWLPKPLGFI